MTQRHTFSAIWHNLIQSNIACLWSAHRFYCEQGQLNCIAPFPLRYHQRSVLVLCERGDAVADDRDAMALDGCVDDEAVATTTTTTARTEGSLHLDIWSSVCCNQSWTMWELMCRCRWRRRMFIEEWSCYIVHRSAPPPPSSDHRVAVASWGASTSIQHEWPISTIFPLNDMRVVSPYPH